MHNLKIRENENKGFSLVELIVVIAIMAVLTAVLAPALLSYVERSRAQKDDSAMSEVTNAVVLGLSDQDVYDEILKVMAANGAYQPSCYIDDVATNQTEANLVTFKQVEATKATTITTANDKDHDQNMYNDECRTKDETSWKAAGNIRGASITFKPVNNVITIADGYIDALEQGKTSLKDDAVKISAATNGLNQLYYRLRSTVGETIELTSATYRKSNYTVFIRMGSQGGTNAESQDLVTAYGQWSGTNLSIDAN